MDRVGGGGGGVTMTSEDLHLIAGGRDLRSAGCRAGGVTGSPSPDNSAHAERQLKGGGRPWEPVINGASALVQENAAVSEPGASVMFSVLTCIMCVLCFLNEQPPPPPTSLKTLHLPGLLLQKQHLCRGAGVLF